MCLRSAREALVECHLISSRESLRVVCHVFSSHTWSNSSRIKQRLAVRVCSLGLHSIFLLIFSLVASLCTPTDDIIYVSPGRSALAPPATLRAQSLRFEFISFTTEARRVRKVSFMFLFFGVCYSPCTFAIRKSHFWTCHILRLAVCLTVCVSQSVC